MILGNLLWINEVDNGENLCNIIALSWLQAICSGTILLCTYISFLYMPFGDAITIVFTCPIITMVISTLFLNDKCKVYKWLCSISLFAGVLLVVQPPFLFEKSEMSSRSTTTKTTSGREYTFGVCMALMSSLAGAFHLVIVGRLFKNNTTNSAILLAFYGGFGGLLIILPAAFLDDNQRIFTKEIIAISWTTWASLALVSLLGLIGFVTINLSIKQIKPVYVSFVGVLEVVMAYVAQVLIFHTPPGLYSILGSIIVVTTVVALPFESMIYEKLPKSMQNIF